MSDFDVVELSEEPRPMSLGFLTRDEEIRVAAATIAAASQATGQYKPTAAHLILVAKEIEVYIRYGK